MELKSRSGAYLTPDDPVFEPLDREAEEIERGRRDGVGGPIVLKWIDQGVFFQRGSDARAY